MPGGIIEKLRENNNLLFWQILAMALLAWILFDVAVYVEWRNAEVYEVLENLNCNIYNTGDIFNPLDRVK